MLSGTYHANCSSSLLMASSSAQKHDFAPAWLKIPSNAQKPSGASLGESSIRREDNLSTINSQFALKPKNVTHEHHRDRGRSGFPYRHHSIDTDDPQHHSPSQYTGGGEYRLTAGQRQHSGSQPSLGRRSLSRQEYREGPSPNFLSGSKGFSSYDGANEFHRGSTGGNSSGHWGRQRSFERNHGGNRTSAGDIGKSLLKDGGTTWQEDKKERFDQEFPSLKGGKGDEEAQPAMVVANGGVWDTNKTGRIHLSSSVGKKLHLVQKPIRNELIKRSSSPKAPTPNASGSGSPKSVSHSSLIKQTTKATSSHSSATSAYHTLMKAPVKSSMFRRVNKDSAKDASKSNGQYAVPSGTTPPLDIINPRLVTHPKNLGNKSDFLKELRDDGSPSTNYIVSGKATMDGCNENEEQSNSDSSSKDSGSQQQTNCEGGSDGCTSAAMQNGIAEQVDDDSVCERFPQSMNIADIQECVNEEQVLSRSLEAEQRLLREMGWKEEGSEDEGVYAPLTEDEMKEFENLSKKIPKRNGFQRNYQFTWSPKRVLTIPNALELENEISGSSISTDSDSD